VIVVYSGLLRAAGSSTFAIWSVAEEALEQTTKALVSSFGDRVMIELFKGIKAPKTTHVNVRSQRVAFRIFATVAPAIPPSRYACHYGR
jgi:hypothetical protein